MPVTFRVSHGAAGRAVAAPTVPPASERRWKVPSAHPVYRLPPTTKAPRAEDQATLESTTRVAPRVVPSVVVAVRRLSLPRRPSSPGKVGTVEAGTAFPPMSGKRARRGWYSPPIHSVSLPTHRPSAVA